MRSNIFHCIVINKYSKQCAVFLKSHFQKKFNIKMGSLAGIITGSIVFYINYDFGMAHALFAFFKQFLFNFFMASYNTKLIERIVYGIKSSWGAVIVGGIVPTIIATSVVFSVHWAGHTPEAWKSSYWQAFFNLPIFTLTALMYQKGIERKFRFLKMFFTTKTSYSESEK